MKEYNILINLADGRVVNRTTTNQVFALRLMQMIVKGDGVKDARIEIGEADQRQAEPDQAKPMKTNT